VRLWDVGSGECYRVLTGHGGAVMAVCSGFIDGTGRLLIATGSADRTVRMWDVSSGECVHVFAGHSGKVQCVSDFIAPRFIASGSRDGTVRVWDIEIGECVRVLREHTCSVTSVSCVVDGSGRQLLVSAACDGAIRLWDMITGECVSVVEGCVDGDTCVSGGFVDGSGRHCFASTSGDGLVRAWAVSTGECVSVVSLNEEMGFSCQRTASCVSVAGSDGRIRLAVVAEKKLAVLELLMPPRGLTLPDAMSDANVASRDVPCRRRRKAVFLAGLWALLLSVRGCFGRR
jgi:WD40 repeat protein